MIVIKDEAMAVKTYSTETVAKRIGVTRQALHNWIAAGRIAAPAEVEMGQQRSILLWTESDIERALRLKGTLKPGPQSRSQKKKKKKKK